MKEFIIYWGLKSLYVDEWISIKSKSLQVLTENKVLVDSMEMEINDSIDYIQVIESGIARYVYKKGDKFPVTL